MERIVGNRWYMFFLFFCSAACAEISMRLTDENGAQLESVGLGRPFLLLVEVKNSAGVAQKDLVIEQLDRYEHFRSGVQMTSVNGNASATYTYRCRIDSPGVHTIGPAVVAGTQEKSSILPVLVNEQPVYARQPKKEDSSVLFRLSIEPNSAVIGQKLIVHAKFYVTDSRMKLQNITLPNFSAFRVVDRYGPLFGKEKVDGVMYEYTEWCIVLYARDSGSHLIPAFCADYEAPNSNSRANFYWGSYAQSKRVYSNSIRVNVEPLPHASRAPDFIGSNATAHASINPAQAKIGEGILYTITLSGDGDMDTLKAPVLKGMPDTIKYYDSKVAAIAGTNDQLPKKQFEYVLQSNKEGAWEIPAQHFEVFDVDKRAYKTVSTPSVMLTTIGGAMASPPRSLLQADEHSDLAQQEGVIRPLHHHGPWYPTSERSHINWTLFFLLVFAPCVYGIVGLVRSSYLNYAYPDQHVRNAYAQARAALERAKKDRKFDGIYHIFILFFAHTYMVAQSQVSFDFMKKKLKEAGASDDLVAQWQAFYLYITEGTFGTAVYARDSNIGEEALKWLDRLKGMLK